MPNWNDPASIKKWLDQQPKTVRTERRRPTEDREERARAEPAKRTWREPAKAAPKKDGPRPESTYKAPPEEHSDTYYEAWKRPGEHRKLDPAYSPYTNYQALPEFVTSQRRNPVGGYAGLEEFPGMRRNQVEFGTYTPPLQGQAFDAMVNLNLGIAGGNPDAIGNYLETMGQDGMASGGMAFGNRPPPVVYHDWGYGDSAALLKAQTPQWRKTDDLWNRIRAADIVPAGQTVPMGQTMRPNYGPVPESTYFSDWTPETIMAAIADGYNKRR